METKWRRNNYCFKKVVLNSVTVICNKYYLVSCYKFTEQSYVLVTFALDNMLEIEQDIGPLHVEYTLGAHL